MDTKSLSGDRDTLLPAVQRYFCLLWKYIQIFMAFRKGCCAFRDVRYISQVVSNHDDVALI